MALFKIFGNFASGNTTLPTSATQGFCYFDKNTGKFYIDTTNAVSGRMALNAEKETQQNQNASGDYRILLSGNANDTTEIAYINKNTNLRFNPGTQLLSVGGSISATGDLIITGDTNLNGETSAESITTNSLLVNGNANFIQIPTAPTPANDSNDTSIATTAFVMSAFTANDAMVFKGTIGTGGTVTALPATHKQGWTYRVITAGTYAGKVCEIGDMIICVTDGTAASNDHWTVVQTNIDGAVTGPASATTDAIAIFNGTTGKIIKDSTKTITTATPASGSTSATIPTSNAVWAAISGASGYGKVGTVTSVQVQATSPVVSSTSTSQTGSLNTTISLADGYGDTKNPYGSKTANYILAAPSGSAGVPMFRALVANDIPSITKSKISDFPTNISAFTNDSGYLTSYTDNKVSQTATTTNANYEILFSGTADNTTRDEGARKTSGLKFNPSTNRLSTSYVSVSNTLTANNIETSTVGDGSSAFLEFDQNETKLQYLDDRANHYSTVKLNDSFATLETEGTQGNSTTNPGAYVCAYTDKVKIGLQDNSGGSIEVNKNGTTINGSIDIGENSIDIDWDPTFINIDGDHILLSCYDGSGATLELNNNNGLIINDGTGTGSNGQVLTSNGTATYWANAIDTKNTVGSTQSTSKVYLVGPTAQSTSVQSYSHTAVYAQDGAMAATSYKVAEKVILQYNTTTDALNFVFV